MCNLLLLCFFGFVWFGLGFCSILFFLLTFIWNSYNASLLNHDDDGDNDDDTPRINDD